jgi:hypothetical protein
MPDSEPARAMRRIDLGGLVRPLFGSGETRSATYPILPDPKSEAFSRGLARQKCPPGART